MDDRQHAWHRVPDLRLWREQVVTRPIRPGMDGRLVRELIAAGLIGMGDG